MCAADRIEEYLPLHLRDFRVKLRLLEPLFATLYQDAHPASRFRKILHDIWKGERGNAGLLRARQRLDDENLLRELKLQNMKQLEALTPQAFYEEFIPLRFMPALNQIVRLSLLQKISPELLNVRALLTRDGINTFRMDSVFNMMVKTLEKHYGLTLRTVDLFKETFDPECHNKTHSDNEAVTVILPTAMGAITKLSPGVIYEIFGVGLHSELVGVDTKPTVIYKE